MAVTYEQALDCSEFHYAPACCKITGPRGGVKAATERWRRNGQTKTWKTRPGQFSIPIKNGLRNYSYLDTSNAVYFHVASECPEGIV